MTAALTAMHSITQPHPMANGAATGDNNDPAASTISANDFLTLLVTEMKNQDPTAQTDPNAYVNQLVQVNSLQQLIQINENLSSALEGTVGTPRAVPATAQSNAAHRPGTLGGAPDNPHHGTGGTSRPIPVSANPVSAFAGNLGISKPIPAAQRIAQALSGRP